VIAVRADGDSGVGLGHVRRCLALATELAPSSDVRFFLKGSEAVASLIRREGFRCEVVPAALEATLAAIGSAGARGLVLDSYEATRADYEAARARAGFLVVLDDSGRYPLPADLVINAAPGVAAPAGENGARYLLGPRFALLRREFAGPVARDVRQRVGRLFLILGGATPSGLVAALARVARQALPAAVVDLVVGPAGDDPSLVVEKLADLDGVNVHAAPESVRPLMLGADLAITGGGFTLFELAATGTPALGVELAPNQRANLAGMVGAGTLVVAGKAEEAGLHEAVGRTLRTLALDVERRRAMSQRGLALVDGRGAVRVAEAIRARLAERRPASERLACSGS